jgi:uncharacterized protein YkwD
VEELEPRRLLAGFQPTAVEQLFLELLNDARANPAAYGATIGLDLSGVAPAQPLAFSPLLIEAARLHAQDMSARSYFDHTTPEGLDPGQRLSATGFAWTGWGESLAAGFPDPGTALAALVLDAGIADLGHRRHLLAIDASFQSHRQIGIGIVLGGAGPYQDYYAVDTAVPADGRPFLTGVVFSDSNGNGRYDLGEGLGGVTITVAGVGSVATFDSGGYSLPVNPGTYTVTASGGGLAAPVTRTVTVGSANYRLNVTAAESQPGTLRFDAAAYAVTESSGSLTVTVLRSGGSNGTVTVTYATGNATAAAGSDYAAAAGTLTFAPGETRKTFTVAILDDAAAEGAEMLTLTLANPSGGATLAAPATAVLAIIDDDSATARWVIRAYVDLFQRPADPSGLVYWAGLLAQGFSRPQVAQALTTSPEFRTLQVQGLYRTLLGRPADAGGLSYWVSYLAAGGTFAQVKAALLGSAEYYQNRGGGTAGGFLTALYGDVLGRPADAGGLAYFSRLLETGFAPAGVALAVVQSPEGLVRLVQGFYQQYLGRAADGAGLTYFVSVLGAGLGDEQVLASILGSEEYAARWG